jgi:hypothetical protein
MSLYHLISSHPVVSCCIMFYLVNWSIFWRTSIPIIPSHQPKSKGQSACWATWRSLRPPRQAPSTSLELRGPLAAAHRSSEGGNGWNRQMQHATRMEHEWKWMKMMHMLTLFWFHSWTNGLLICGRGFPYNFVRHVVPWREEKFCAENLRKPSTTNETFPANLDDPMLFTEYHPSS